MKTTRIKVVSANYPSKKHPQQGAFVHALALAWSQQGVDVEVVAPRSRFEGAEAGVDPGGWRGLAEPRPRVLRPPFSSFSNRRLPGGFSTFRCTSRAFGRSVIRACHGAPSASDIVYGHFLLPAGAAASRVARDLRVPAFAALGESALQTYEDHFTATYLSRLVRSFTGLVSVSRENARIAIERFGAREDRILVLPNATDTQLFRPGSRAAARKTLGLPADRPIVAFTGHFIERKGPLRLLAALADVPEAAAVFLGSGPERPTGAQVLRAAPVPHEDLPIWLQAADLFALPTLAEGCPNAVVEAMACGLPIVSSDIPAVREIVGDGPALLVDPRSANALAGAIRTVLGEPGRRERMGRAAVERGSRLSIGQRAARILSWMVELAPDAELCA